MRDFVLSLSTCKFVSNCLIGFVIFKTIETTLLNIVYTYLPYLLTFLKPVLHLLVLIRNLGADIEGGKEAVVV